jgi:flagellar biogenesis protein FliO
MSLLLVLAFSLAVAWSVSKLVAGKANPQCGVAKVNYFRSGTTKNILLYGDDELGSTERHLI